MVVGDLRAGHVRSDRTAVRLGVILVLDPETVAQGGDREVRDVTGGKDIFVPLDAPHLIDDDPIVDREAGGLGQAGGRLDAKPGDDDVRLELPVRIRS